MTLATISLSHCCHAVKKNQLNAATMRCSMESANQCNARKVHPQLKCLQPIKSRPVTQTLSDFDQRQCQCQCQRNQIQLNCSNVLSTTAVRTFLFPGTLSRFPTNDVDISRSGAAGAGRGGRLSGLEAAHPKIEH